MANSTATNIANNMINGSYSLATDGSNDANSQLYPIVVRYFDSSLGNVVAVILSVPACKEGCTGESIFNLVDRELVKKNIPWYKCLAFGCDNASVMTGRNKGVIAFIREHQRRIFLQGCPCHLVYLAAEKASRQLQIN